MIQIIPQIVLFGAVAAVAFIIGRRIPRSGEIKAQDVSAPTTVQKKLRQQQTMDAIKQIWNVVVRTVRRWGSKVGSLFGLVFQWVRLKLERRKAPRDIVPEEAGHESFPESEIFVSEEMQKVTRLVKQCRFAEAEKEYISLIKDNPKDKELYAGLGVMYLEQRAYSDAKNALQYAVQLGDRRESTTLELARAQFKAGDKKECLETLDTLLSMNPRIVEALVLSARVYHELGDSTNERICWNKVKVYDPNNVDAQVALGGHEKE